MWILPADLSGVHVELTAGPHLVPWYYSEEEIDRLSWLLRLTLKGVEGELRLDDATLRVLSDRRVTAPTSLVVAVVRERSTGLDEITERVLALRPRCALLQLPEPEEMGYGWLERQVKAPLYRAIGAWVKRPEHPLVAFNVQALSVMEAAALTTDPVELMHMLERAITHRLRYATVGVEEVDYRRSLYLSAGERLAERVGGLEAEALRAAVEIMLNHEETLGERERFRAGAVALERVGLARFIAGDLALGPLARSIQEPGLLGALESSLPPGSLTDNALARIVAIRKAYGPPANQVPIVALAGVGSAEPPAVGDDADDAVIRMFPGEPAAVDTVRLLREIVATPLLVRELPAGLRQRATGALRWLEATEQSSSIEKRGFARIVTLQVLFFMARGPDVLEQQAKILPSLEAALVEVPQALVVVKLHHIWSLIVLRRSADDAIAAETLARDCIELCRTADFPSDHIAALRVASTRLALATVAIIKAEYAAAREWSEKSLDAARAADHDVLVARAIEMLALIAREEGRPDEAERKAREALTLREKLGDELGIESALRLLAGILLIALGTSTAGSAQDKRAELEQIVERARRLAEQMGDVEGKAESLLIIGAMHLLAFEVALAEPLIREALTLYEDIGSTVGRAESYYAIGGIQVIRLALDEAVSTLTQARELYEKLGWRARVETVKTSLAQVSVLSTMPVTAALRAMGTT